MAKLRLGVLTAAYEVGGAERYLADLINGLDPNDVQLTLVAPAYADALAYFRSALGERIEVISYRPLQLVPNRHSDGDEQVTRGDGGAHAGRWSTSSEARLRKNPEMLRTLQSIVRLALLPFNIRRLRRIDQRAMDVLLVNNGGYPAAGPALAGLFAARRRGVGRTILVVHNEPAPRATLTRPLEKLLDRSVARRTDRFVSVGPDIGRMLADRRGIDARRITHVPTGIRVPKVYMSASDARRDLNLPEAVPVVGMVASFEPRKRHDLAVEAIELVWERHPDVVLAFMGDGRTSDHVQALAARTQRPSQIRFLGKRDARKLMPAFDIVLLASDGEALPLTLLEGMAASRPVVASDVGDVGSVCIDGVSGALVPPGSAAALAGALTPLVESSDLRRRLGENGRRLFEADHSFSEMTTRYIRVITGSDT